MDPFYDPSSDTKTTDILIRLSLSCRNLNKNQVEHGSNKSVRVRSSFLDKNVGRHFYREKPREK